MVVSSARSRVPWFWVALVSLVAAASSAQAWLFTLPGSRESAARALAVAPGGAVVAAGDVALGIRRPFGLFRLDPDTGDLQGLYLHDPTLDGRAWGLAMLGEDAVAAGETASPESASQFLVTRSDAQGVETWATALDGAASCGQDVAYAVALDPEGGVLAAGQVTNTTDFGDLPAFTVVKLDVADGSVRWQREIDGGTARAVVLDGFDAIVAGVVDGAFTVARLAGDTGAILWQTTVGPGDAVALVAGPEGSVYAAGQLGGAFAVVKLETDTGTALWTAEDGIFPATGFARGLVRLGNGDVVATGEFGTGPGRTWATVRLPSAGGPVLWQDPVEGVLSPAAGHGVARNAADDVVSVGTAAGEGAPASFASRSVFGQDGSFRWETGIFSDDAGTRALTVLVDDAGDVLVGGQLSPFSFFAPSFTVQKLRGEDGSDFEPLCGNDVLDPGEDCDDANTFDGDCCSSTCKFESPTELCAGDGNECTTDRCDGEGTCIHPPLADQTPCDDENECTVGEACFGGECGSADATEPGSFCDADANLCTDDACDGQGNCVATPNTDPCDDFNPCTGGDQCTQGFCFGEILSGNSCDDFNPCTTSDTCADGSCFGTPAPGLQCFSDGNPCTDDVCGVEGFCEHPNNTAPCDDVDACTTADQCENGVCTGTPGGGTTSTSTSTSTTTSSSSTSSTSTSASTSTSTSSSTSTTTTTPASTTTTSTTTLAPTTTTSTTATTSTSTSSSTSTSTTIPAPTTTTSSSSSTSTSSTTSAPATTTTSTSTTAPATTSTSTTTTPTTSSSTTTTLPPACETSADCDDGDPCNGGEVCSDGRCLVPRGAGPTCRPADQLALVTSFAADAVQLVNVRTRAVEGTLAVGRAPWGVAWLPGGARALVTNRDDRSVSVLDVVARTVTGTVAVGRQPLGIAAHPFLPRAYVAAYDDDRVDVIDTGTLQVVDRIAVGNGPAGLAVHPAGGELYVANYLAGTVSVVDLATGAVTANVATPALPVGVAIHPGGAKAYVACLKGRAVATIGTVSHSLLGTIPVGRRPVGVDFDAAGDRAYVTNSRDDSVTVIDATADQALSEVPVGGFPLGVAVAADGGVWVTNSESDDCAVVEGGAVDASVATPGKPVSIGRFIGTPPDDCPALPLPCDDANPYTGDACTPGVGCSRAEIAGVAALRAGVGAIQAIVEDAPEDPLVAEVGAALPALQSALAAAETGPDRAALRLVRKTLKPILARLERARRRGELTGTAARLLDVAREARKQLVRLARQGG